jgi:hypothetical protein
VGVKHCIAASNETVALEIATRALRLAREVIIPSFTFVASGLTWGQDPRTHERMINAKTVVTSSNPSLALP